VIAPDGRLRPRRRQKIGRARDRKPRGHHEPRLGTRATRRGVTPTSVPAAPPATSAPPSAASGGSAPVRDRATRRDLPDEKMDHHRASRRRHAGDELGTRKVIHNNRPVSRSVRKRPGSARGPAHMRSRADQKRRSSIVPRAVRFRAGARSAVDNPVGSLGTNATRRQPARGPVAVSKLLPDVGVSFLRDPYILWFIGAPPQHGGVRRPRCGDPAGGAGVPTGIQGHAAGIVVLQHRRSSQGDRHAVDSHPKAARGSPVDCADVQPKTT
jgi:hypothetical protein